MARRSDKYAELNTPTTHLTLAARMTEKGFGPMRLSRYCELKSHGHISALKNGVVRTTSPETAQRIEEALDATGMFFTIKTAKPVGLVMGKAA